MVSPEIVRAGLTDTGLAAEAATAVGLPVPLSVTL